VFLAKLIYQIKGHHDSIVRKIFYVIFSLNTPSVISAPSYVRCFAAISFVVGIPTNVNVTEVMKDFSSFDSM
jgi:hypothetical protein